MSIQRHTQCPICKLEEQDVQVWDYGERLTLKCARCGDFTITRTAAAMAQSRDLGPRLSAWIRGQSESGTQVPEINSGMLKDLEGTLPAYTVAQKQVLLLKALERRTTFPGQAVDVISRFDYPLAWAAGEEELFYLLRSLSELNLARRTDGPSDLNDSFTFKFEITANGWAVLQDQTSASRLNKSNQTYDIFISHASEDKDAIARPLYRALIEKGLSVWFDEAVLALGDSLRRKIDEGLARCRYGVVILSPHFLSKQWPQRELDGLVARETSTGEKAILPVWHHLDREILVGYSPTLADKIAVRSDEGIPTVVEKILDVLGR
jgi:hypothetical protein